MKSSDEILMDKIMKVVNEHLDDPALNVEMLASEVGLSRVHVHRKLKELTNLSARDFIKNIRLQQAATLLAQDQKAYYIGDCLCHGIYQPVAFFQFFPRKIWNVSERVYEST